MGLGATASADPTSPHVLSVAECNELLDKTRVGRIAFVVEGTPVVLPVNYRWLESETGRWIVLRTRPGNSIDDAPEQVAFEIDGIDTHRHVGWSVLVGGVLHHLDHNEVELMMTRFDPKPWVRDDRTAWLAIKPRRVTGRRLESPDLEWAFSSGAYL